MGGWKAVRGRKASRQQEVKLQAERQVVSKAPGQPLLIWKRVLRSLPRRSSCPLVGPPEEVWLRVCPLGASISGQ